MRSFESRLAACAGIGLAVGGFVVGCLEAQEGFDPAHVRQEQVDTCTPYMPVAEQLGVTEVPKQCETFADDLIAKPYAAHQGLTYNLPAQKDFRREFSPSVHYNRDQFLKWATAGGFWGLTITTAGLLLINDMPSENDPSNDPKPSGPRPVQQLSVREYRRRYAQSANSLPPDNLSNGDLRWFVAQAIERQRAAEN
ncbi:MAG TPA: hypothetical protein VN031_03055 [Candidatus Microsaccharimonas sp.]|nr:hypothetical protein [Candidatus Microsaccharimonas sp.]